MVTKITNLSDVAIVEYVYDDGGFRSKKKNYTAGVLTKTTLYVRDLSGQITGIYEKSSSVYNLVETPFYGSSRLGTKYGLNTYVYELKDHLGNIRQTIKTIGGDIPVETSADWAYSKAEYYPFGMKFMNSFSGANPYRYGYQGEYAEDETEEDGIQANSFQLRLYNPRLGRWMSPDPKHEFHSPYLSMGNNPISLIDPDGGSIESTIVTQNEDGTYTVVGGDAYDGDNGIYLSDGNGGKGKLIGYSATPHSFYYSDIEKVVGDGTGAWMGIINPYDMDGKNFLNNKILADNPDVATYMLNATGGEPLDFKVTNGEDEKCNVPGGPDHYRGMPLIGTHNNLPIYGSARDVGNIAAGVVAGRAGISWDVARLALDGLESWQFGEFRSELSSTQFGQKLGHNLGISLYKKEQLSRLPGNGHLKTGEIILKIMGLDGL